MGCGTTEAAGGGEEEEICLTIICEEPNPANMEGIPVVFINLIIPVIPHISPAFKV
jgi:hypothetical protein